ncbi:hypothetical protein C8R41DRAFT_418942 [Lentinula lateritia]|uniref:Uncharacterized protein n=1 Tax=Lentinula lateritia TaxID=40482 RepID=A0ABQ8VBZ0_9AGAR|nr:hypothetical protein C8R41DRAFT_418942 [Lentinula lateritia]
MMCCDSILNCWPVQQNFPPLRVVINCLSLLATTGKAHYYQTHTQSTIRRGHALDLAAEIPPQTFEYSIPPILARPSVTKDNQLIGHGTSQLLLLPRSKSSGIHCACRTSHRTSKTKDMKNPGSSYDACTPKTLYELLPACSCSRYHYTSCLLRKLRRLPTQPPSIEYPTLQSPKRIRQTYGTYSRTLRSGSVRITHSG